MKKLLNGGSIVSACCNSYDRNKANGRITSFVEHFSVADSVLRQLSCHSNGVPKISVIFGESGGSCRPMTRASFIAICLPNAK